MKRIVLCADDYGQNIAISQAILELVGLRRLSAVSCLTTGPDWLSRAALLKPFYDKIDIGLHFNLTEGPLLTQLSHYHLKKLLLKAGLRQLTVGPIVAELEAQLDQFIAGTGRYPDFIDGHQHVHQLPIVRQAVIEVYQSRFKDRRPYIRSVWRPMLKWQTCPQDIFKQMIIQLSGAATFKKILSYYSIPHNTSFAGIYIFSHSNYYPQFFIRFLKQIKQNGLIMCHPGMKNEGPTDDTIAGARFDEYHFLMSEQFTEICKMNQISIARFQDS